MAYYYKAAWRRPLGRPGFIIDNNSNITSCHVTLVLTAPAWQL